MPSLRWAPLPATLVAAILAVAALTARLPDPPAAPTDDGRPPVAAAAVRLGAATPDGVAAYRPGRDGGIHVAMVDAAGRTRWTRSLDATAVLPVCAPCPAAWVLGPAGAEGIDADGRPTATPLPAGAPVRTLGVGQPVLLVGGEASTDTWTVWTVGRHGPMPLGRLPSAVVADPRVQAAAAADGSAVTVVGPHPDPLRLAEARITHLRADGADEVDVAIRDAGTRAFPCLSDGADRWAVLVAGLGGGGSGPHATVVGRGPDVPRQLELPSFFDGCAVGAEGLVLWTVTIGGAGGDGAELDVAVVVDGAVAASSHRFATPPSVAADPARARLAAVAPTGGRLVAAGSTAELPGAAAATYDALGGLWLATADPLTVRRRP